MSVLKERTWVTKSGEKKSAWCVIYSDVQGKRRMKTFKRGDNKAARRFQVNVDKAVQDGVHVAESVSVTVAKAAEDWITRCEAHGRERSTLETYRRIVKLHINPHIGRMKLSQLNSSVLSTFEDNLLRGNPAPGEEIGYTRSAVITKKVLGVLSMLLSDAMRRGYTSHNIARDYRSGSQAGADHKAEKRQKGKLRIGTDIPSRAEIKLIVDHLEPRWRPIILTLVFTGLRSSELRGLRWGSIDFNKNELHVCERVDQYGAFGAPKSAAGERIVPLPSIVTNTLRELKLKSPHSADSDLVFTSKRGGPLFHNAFVLFGWQPAQVKAGVVTADGKAKYPGLHSARHFYASWCINSKADGGLGLSAKAAQSRLGHSSITLTLDVYGHLFRDNDTSSELAAAASALLD